MMRFRRGIIGLAIILMGCMPGIAVAGTAPTPTASPLEALPTALPTPAASGSPASGSATAAPSPATPSASPSPMMHTFTEDEAVRFALRENHTLKAAERQEQQAYWAWKVAGKVSDMTVALGYTGGKSVNTYNSFTRDAYAVVSQSFGPLSNTAWNGKAAEKAYEAAHANVLATRVTIRQNVKDAFYGLLIAQEQLRVADENLKLANDLFNMTKKKFEVGAGPKMDVLNAEIQQSTAEQAVIQAGGALKQAQAALAPILSMPATEPLQAQGGADLPEVRLVFDRLSNDAQANHPQIVMAIKTVEQSQLQVHATRSQINPTPSVSYVYDPGPVLFGGPVTGPEYIWLGQLSFPLDWGQIRYGVRQQQAVVKANQETLQATRLSIASNVKSAWEGWLTAKENASTYLKKVLDPSEKLVTITTRGFKSGALPLLQLVVAEQNLRTARTQYYALLLTGHQALDALEAAVGETLDQTQNGKT